MRLRGPDTQSGKAEHRLPLLIIGAVLLPFAMALYGWLSEIRAPVALVLASTAFLDCTLLLNVIPLQAYVVDAFGLYSASAMTSVIVTRCLMGTFLPLATGPLASWLGYGWAFTLLGVLAAVVGIIPVLVMKNGTQWRQRSEYSKDK